METVVTAKRIRALYLPAMLLVLTCVACSTSPSVTLTYRDPAFANSGFSNLLVVVLVSDYEARTRFERELSSALVSSGTRATAYYEVAAGDQEVTREKIVAAIRSTGADGVVVTRLDDIEHQASVKSGTIDTKVTRRSDTAMDFFRYDYEELNEPGTLSIATKATLLTDVFDASREAVVWSAETALAHKENILLRIDEAAKGIAGRLAADGMLSH